MSTSPVNSSTGTGSGASSTTNADIASAESEKNEFLQILLTQLQNQNPMDPTKPEDFASQLAQFSALEQQIDTNTKLDTLNDTVSQASVSPISYIGTTVDYTSNVAPIQNGDATWTYTTAGATGINITVTDETGAVVYTGTGDTSSGPHTLTLSAGTSEVDGAPLTISVTATDDTGAAITPTVSARATIDAVDMASTGVTLDASGYSVDGTLVTRIALPAANTADNSDSSGDSSTNNQSGS